MHVSSSDWFSFSSSFPPISNVWNFIDNESQQEKGSVEDLGLFHGAGGLDSKAG